MLHLLPAPLFAEGPEHLGLTYTPFTEAVLLSVQHWYAEDARVVRRVVAWAARRAAWPKAATEAHLAACTFTEVSEHTPAGAFTPALLAPVVAGTPAGLMTDAGLPAVADPGAPLVALAHELGLPVVPHPGPSSLLMALMASGLGGQQFQFGGYLPRQAEGRRQGLRLAELQAWQQGTTQIFIETPYRNEALWADALAVLRPDTRLCAAVALQSYQQYIATRTVAAWRSMGPPPFIKLPAVFLLGR